MSKVKMDGLQDLIKGLENIGQGLDDKFIKSVLVNAAAPIVATMKAKCPKKSGRLASSIGIIDANNSLYPTLVLIGPDFKAKIKKVDKADNTMTIQALASVVEFGAKIRKPKSSKKNKSKEYRRVLINGQYYTMSLNKPFAAIPARPFIRPAYEMHKDSAQKEIMEALMKEIKNKAKINNIT